MSSALSSQVVAVVATAVAISGTAILLAISMQKSGVAVSTSSFFHLVSSSNPKTSKSSKQLTSRSCFSNPDGKSKKKKKKKVRFAEDVKDSVGNSEEYRRANHKRLLLIKTTTDDHTTKNCRGQSSSSGSCSTRGGGAAPENWAAVVDPCRLCSN